METLHHLLQTETFWVMISTVLCVGFIAFKAYRPLLASLDARADMIRVRLAEAETLHEEAQRILEEYKQKSRTAAAEAEQVLRNAQVRADNLRADMEKELHETMARQEASLKVRIARLEAEAIESVKQGLVTAALQQVRETMENDGAKAGNLSGSLDRITKTMH